MKGLGYVFLGRERLQKETVPLKRVAHFPNNERSEMMTDRDTAVTQKRT